MEPAGKGRRQIWAEQYGSLAGWLHAITGVRAVSFEIADEAFVRLFCRGSLRRRTRQRLYARALVLVERSGLAPPATRSAPQVAWLGRLVADLPKVQRRCVLLHHAGLDPGEIGAVLHLRPATVERAIQDWVRSTMPRPRPADVLTPRRDDEAAASVR